jgi:glyoxylate/hydroxypyruvate reductase A
LATYASDFLLRRHQARPWLQGLRAPCRAPRWPSGRRAPAGRLRPGLGAAPAFLDEQPGLKALFNIGAGVDALLPLRLPPDLPVYRLEDAGMAVQMAEYVARP